MADAVMRPIEAASLRVRKGHAATRAKHGLTGTRAYDVWASMRQRCFDPKFSKYAYYGGRGIKICPRWNDFLAFLEDMGEPAPGMTLERKDVNGDYEPGNCCWASRKEQARNRRSNRLIEYQGRSHCVAEWAEITGIGWPTILYRLDRGWPVEDVLTKPPRPIKRIIPWGGQR